MSPYLRGFEDGRQAALKQVDKRIAEFEGSPMPEMCSTELVILRDIRARIEQDAK